MSRKKQGDVVTTATVDMARLVRLAASPAIPGEKVPHAIARAARRLGFQIGRTTSFWYGKAKMPSAEELDTARRVAVERAKDAELLRNEYRRAIEILARLETRLATQDQDFHGPSIDALRDVVRRPDRS